MPPPGRQYWDRHGVLDLGGLGIAVVLAGEHYGELPDSRKVHGLVQGPETGSSFLEESDSE